MKYIPTFVKNMQKIKMSNTCTVQIVRKKALKHKLIKLIFEFTILGIKDRWKLFPSNLLAVKNTMHSNVIWFLDPQLRPAA